MSNWKTKTKLILEPAVEAVDTCLSVKILSTNSAVAARLIGKTAPRLPATHSDRWKTKRAGKLRQQPPALATTQRSA